MADPQGVIPFPSPPRQQVLVRTMATAALLAAERRDLGQPRQLRPNPTQYGGLAAYIRQQWDMMVRHRNTVNGWSDRLLSSMRAMQGQYDPQKLAEIRKFGGSEVYARLAAAKCRGATSLLRDVYLGADRAWGLQEPKDPTIPLESMQAIEQLVTLEVQSAGMGAPEQGVQPEAPNPDAIQKRVFQLMSAARDAAKRHAHEQTLIAEDKLDEILTQGNFYNALAEFLIDLPGYPFACIKGPTVRQ